jgi:hypothetical protein
MAIIWNTFVVYENLVQNDKKELFCMAANNYRTPVVRLNGVVSTQLPTISCD